MWHLQTWLKYSCNIPNPNEGNISYISWEWFLYLIDTNVDDGTVGVTKKEVQGMLGSKLPDGSYGGAISSMMKILGIEFKTIHTSKLDYQEAIEKLSDKVLDCLWGPTEDLMGRNLISIHQKE